MKILAIGNSFSTDATRYLYSIARSQGESWQVANLYIGGCPLERHFRNMLTGANAYELQWNGIPTGFYVSIKEALLSRSWDVITLQQASALSGNYESYQPYLNQLADYVRKLCPKAKLVIHQTWAYETGSEKLSKLGYATTAEMFAALESAYAQAVKDTGAQLLIPSGQLFESLRNHGFPLHRDTFHASLGPGRYALGLLWYRALTGASVLKNTFRDFDEPVSEEQIRLICRYVEETV